MPQGQRLICPTCGAVFRNQFPRCPRDGAALSALERDPLIGASFADRYIIEECVGEGGMGRVYRARHQRMSRKFAVKVLYGDHAAEPKMRERFVREAEAACRLSHPNVISVLDFGETATEQLYLVMDYVEGRSLARVIAEEAPFASQRIRSLLRQLCLGLAHAHEHGLVHRDFKGDNVIITGSGVYELPRGGASPSDASFRHGGPEELARIVDFGLAVITEAPEQRLTTEGVVLGTPAFMSPEQAVGEELDLRTDLFSLGVVLYEMLAGVLPFEGNPIAIARQNLACEPPRIQDRVPGLFVDGYLEQIARTLMEKKPADRYQSAREVIAALDQAQAVEAGATEPMKPAPGIRAPTPPPVAPRDRATEVGHVSRNRDIPEAHDSTLQVAQERSSWQRRLLVAALLVVLIGAGALVVQQLGSASETSAQAEPQARAQPRADMDRAAQPVVPGDVAAPEAVPEAMTDDVAVTDDVAATGDVREHGPAGQDPAEAGGDRADTASGEPAQPGQRGGDEPDSATRAERPSRTSRTGDARKSESSRATESRSAPVTTATLTELYQSVGKDLDRLIAERGAVAAERFRATYNSIPFHDALRTPSLRRDALDKLRRLQRKLRRKLEQSSKE